MKTSTTELPVRFGLYVLGIVVLTLVDVGIAYFLLHYKLINISGNSLGFMVFIILFVIIGLFNGFFYPMMVDRWLAKRS